MSMSNNNIILEEREFRNCKLRYAVNGNKIWYCAADLAKAINMKNETLRSHIQQFNKPDKIHLEVNGNKMNFIAESIAVNIDPELIREQQVISKNKKQCEDQKVHNVNSSLYYRERRADIEKLEMDNIIRQITVLKELNQLDEYTKRLLALKIKNIRYSQHTAPTQPRNNHNDLNKHKEGQNDTVFH